MFVSQQQINKMQAQQYIIIKITLLGMLKNNQRILQLKLALSKLMDSLCFQLSVNKVDDNCLSLLEILVWQRKGEIDDTQFVQLYRSWLESKSVMDLFGCKQLEIFPKHQLIDQQIVQQNFNSISQINKALEKLNDAYNKLYSQKKPNNIYQLEQAQKIFAYLDPSGYIHIRLSNIFFFTAATLILERYRIPLNYELFKLHMNDIRRQMCEIQGMIYLRCFKNYLLNLNSAKRATYLDNLLPIIAEIQIAIGSATNGLPNLYDQVFFKWKTFPRFNSGENKKNLDIYRRVFEENERVFFDEGATVEYFLQKYGEDFVKCFQIDSALLRQFNALIKESLNHYVEIFSKVAQKLSTKQKEKREKDNYLFMTYQKKPIAQFNQYTQAKPVQKSSSLREKTPTKSQKTIQYRNRTPTKSVNFLNQQNEIRKQFGSAQKNKQKTSAFREVTPTKSHRPQGLYQSQAYTASKNGLKLGIDQDSVYNRMMFFRNKRVQSYDIVMKRLKNK